MAIRDPRTLAGAALVATALACSPLALRASEGRTGSNYKGWQPAEAGWTNTKRSVEPTVEAAPIGLGEFAERRQRLARAVGGPSAILVQARSSEEHMEPFFQTDDFWYLTGVAWPDVALLLEVDGSGQLAQETLFLPAHDPMFERWNGARPSPGPEAEQALGVANTELLPPRSDAYSRDGSKSKSTYGSTNSRSSYLS